MVEQELSQLVGHPLAKLQVDPLRVVDVKPKRVRARGLEGDQLDLRIELRQALLYVALKVCHLLSAACGPKKKWARPTFRRGLGTWKSLRSV
jgi:hypothetical protein